MALASVAGPEEPRTAAWDEAEAARWAAAARDPALGLCVYASRLLGADADLVLGGGGNTSVKSRWPETGGGEIEVLWVKASGGQLATIGPEGFTPVDLLAARRLLAWRGHGDLRRELRQVRLDPGSPDPSIETLLHAFLPYRFVTHTHPAAVLALTGTPLGVARAHRLLGPRYPMVPWAAPGHDLAQACRGAWRAAAGRGSEPHGFVLLRHGLVTFADDPRTAVERTWACAATSSAALPRAEPTR
jgi:rhamnose utilization protein RhaD (predicted bifunctional aldolase and dehydrogenase)